jgi:hypothetical protein
MTNINTEVSNNYIERFESYRKDLEYYANFEFDFDDLALLDQTTEELEEKGLEDKAAVAQAVVDNLEALEDLINADVLACLLDSILGYVQSADDDWCEAFNDNIFLIYSNENYMSDDENFVEALLEADMLPQAVADFANEHWSYLDCGAVANDYFCNGWQQENSTNTTFWYACS